MANHIEVYHQNPSEMRCCPDGEAYVFENQESLSQHKVCLKCDLNGHRPTSPTRGES